MMPPPDQDPTANDTPAAAGARAARLLRIACRSALKSRTSLLLEVVRDAALDLERALEVLADYGDPAPVDLLAESAARCADTANLAACAVPELPEEEVSDAISATRLAVAAIHALYPLIEAKAGEIEEDHVKYALRDARGAMWRADLVIRQLEEASPED